MNNQDTTHIVSYQKLLLILLALFAFTAVTIGISRVDLGAFNIWGALLIATLKSSLVLLYFMHLRYENRLIGIGLIVTLGFVAILIGFLFWDISFR